MGDRQRASGKGTLLYGFFQTDERLQEALFLVAGGISHPGRRFRHRSIHQTGPLAWAVSVTSRCILVQAPDGHAEFPRPFPGSLPNRALLLYIRLLREPHVSANRFPTDPVLHACGAGAVASAGL